MKIYNSEQERLADLARQAELIQSQNQQKEQNDLQQKLGLSPRNAEISRLKNLNPTANPGDLETQSIKNISNMSNEEKLQKYYELHPELGPKTPPKLDPVFLEQLIQDKGDPIPNPPMSVGTSASTGEYEHPMSDDPSLSSSSPQLSTQRPLPSESLPNQRAPGSRNSIQEEFQGMRSTPESSQNLSNLMFGQNKDSTVENLKKAQQARDDERGSARRDRLAALLGSSASGVKNDYLTEEADRKDKLAPEKVADFEQQTAMQKSDPNSAVSKGYRDMMKQFGVNVQGDASASDMEKIAPWIAKAYEGKENRDQQKDLMKYKYKELAAMNKLKGQERDAETSNKDALKLQEHLDKGWAARGGQAGVIQNKINSAEAAEALIDQGRGQPGGLDSRQIEELAQSTARLLGGSNTASARVEALVPHTLTGKSQTLKEFLTNEPQPQQMQAFTDRLAETVQREKELAKNQKRSFQVEGLAAHKRFREKNPDLYNQILESKGIDSSSIDEKGRYKPSNYSEGQEKGIQRVMDHNNVSRAEAIKALQKAGKL